MPSSHEINSSSNQNHSRGLLSPPQSADYESPSRQDLNVTNMVEVAVHTKSPNKVFEDYLKACGDVISPQSTSFADLDANSRNIKNPSNNFADNAKMLIDCLKVLRELHPFLGTTIEAFTLVVTLDLTRRDNDKKVLAVKEQMANMMKSLILLKDIQSPSEKEPNRMTIANRLEPLIPDITRDIIDCGRACDAYTKKGILAKTIKSSKYEARLIDFATRFTEHRQSLELKLSIHTSLGMDSVTQKLHHQDSRLQSIEEYMKMLFRNSDSQRERDLLQFLEENGGAKACITNDELLKELVAKSGESSSRFPGRESGRRSNELPGIRKRLLKELREDVDETFRKNTALFEKKLSIQSKHLTETIHQQAHHIISTLQSGAHDRIADPDLRNIWKDMGWKGSVKARHFVLALYDYYTDKLSSASDEEPLPGVPSSRTPERGDVVPGNPQDDQWALAYINAAYVQPILEAVDDDGTGFVSIKEVNTFVTQKPDNLSLLHWIAYWAAGWQASMSRYKDKIYELVQTMFHTLEHVLPSNRRAVDEYLFHPSFWRIELLLRSTRSATPIILGDPDLSKITESYERTEEQRLQANLQEIAYQLDSTATVSLITRAGRIERHAFPLIFLLLQRHLKVIRLACKHVLDTEEFFALSDSLVYVLLAIDHRVQNVEAIFKQTHFDVHARFGNFAFGIFQLSHGDIKREPANNSFAFWPQVDSQENSSVRSEPEINSKNAKSLAAEIPHDTLQHGIQDGYSVTDYYEFDHLDLDPNTIASIEGTWTGHYRRQYGDEWKSCVLRISIRLVSQDKFTGKGEDFVGAFEFTGELTALQEQSVQLQFTVPDTGYGVVRSCSGTLDMKTAGITAQWNTIRLNNTGDADQNEPFTLRRTPPSLLRYRYTEDRFAEDPVRSRWSFACSAALHQAQETLWSRRFFEARFTERKKYVALTTRALIVLMELTPQVPLTPVEEGELEYLRQVLNPSEARFYQALAEFEIQKLPWHPAWGCDFCERRITKCRILCVQCISEDLSDNIDLCASCIDRTPAKRTFIHEVSHPVVKVEQTLHDYYLADIVEAARATFERIQGYFRLLESSSSKEGQIPYPSCVCCNKDVLPHCWVCVICTKDTFICTDCDSKRLPSLVAGHSHSHALVRIRVTSLQGDSASADERLHALEQRLIAIEYKVAESSAALSAAMETRIDEQIAALEARVEARLVSLETKLEDRFSTLEAVLRQIATQTAALPAVYGQVVRDSARSHSARKH